MKSCCHCWYLIPLCWLVRSLVSVIASGKLQTWKALASLTWKAERLFFKKKFVLKHLEIVTVTFKFGQIGMRSLQNSHLSRILTAANIL